MNQELYKKHRPTSFKTMKGQDETVEILKGLVKKKKVPHCILLSGPSGCGKTTLGRILKKKLNCGDADFYEVNAADFKGIDTVRDLRSRINFSPIDGDCRIWLIDECHELTKQAQNAFLKMLEDTPSHVFFILATTHPDKLLPTIKTRATHFVLGDIDPLSLQDLIQTVAKKEKIRLSEEVTEALVDHSEGSARKALVLLHQISELDEEDRVDAIEKADTKRAAIELARALISPRGKWTDVASIIKDLDEDPESLRWMILSYSQSVVLGGGKLAKRAAFLLEIFGENFYDSKKAGLTLACWNVFHGE